MSEELAELFNGEAGLFDDGAERSGFEVAATMERHGDGSRLVAGKREHVVASNDAVDDEPGSFQCANDSFCVDGRQPSAAHAEATTVTRRISGGVSAGISRW